ncbi:hypothetical protein FE36_18510 [Xanthomonas oryzae pv. oryzicola]|nr:hypothetical protein FE36_18510 [Xanthomonas oryzae pv. oryzicola]AKN99400.1 hypothetical protein ACU15_01405 [Xanthomonas oryzae pv. oryzicola]KOR47470.1 hypothetical protein ADT27_08430 [Xanthomonas oryzae]
MGAAGTQGLQRSRATCRTGHVRLAVGVIVVPAVPDVLAALCIAQQGGACADPLRSRLQARRCHVEGQMHAAHRTLRLHAFQRGPVDADGVAMHGQRQHIAVET